MDRRASRANKHSGQSLYYSGQENRGSRNLDAPSPPVTGPRAISAMLYPHRPYIMSARGDRHVILALGLQGVRSMAIDLVD